MATANTAAKKPATTRSKTATKKTATTKVTTKTATTKKTAAPRTPATKPAPKATTAKKPVAPRAKATVPRSAKVIPSPEQRHRMIEQAAYFLAEKHSFTGQSVDYWIAAEAQIDSLISGSAK